MHHLLYLSLALSSASVALADCCKVGPCLPDPGLSCIQKCGDGTDGTPCCGVGGCNIFCCNCDGGCRGAGTTKRDATSGDDSTMNDDEAFAAADVDSSGNITMAQYMAYMRPGANMGLYIDRFHQHDKDGNGVITPNEMRLGGDDVSGTHSTVSSSRSTVSGTRA